MKSHTQSQCQSQSQSQYQHEPQSQPKSHDELITIHDPIHGTIDVTPAEIKLIDSRAFQRLRYIKQLGFADLAFPGATHTRYAHSLGAMRVATGIIERVLDVLPLDNTDKIRFRQSIRLAVLFHDLGHAPMSHVSEKVMPQVRTLKLGDWATPNDHDRQATHEDYTVKLLTDSELTQSLAHLMGDAGITGARLAALVTGQPAPNDPDAFVIAGNDYLPLLHQIVSGELDADRMDYLRRDAYYCGVPYGNFDHTWLTKNITAVQHEGTWVLALRHRGVWAFENFLLARLHMFLAVYFHHTSIGFDHVLGRYFESGEYSLPSDSEQYLQTDDMHLIRALRTSHNPWAQSIVQRRPYKMLIETHDFGADDSHDALDQALHAAGITFFRTASAGALSKYVSYVPSPNAVSPLLVVEPELARIRRVEDYTPLYRRFDDVVHVSRVYCDPNQIQQARALLQAMHHP